MAPATITYTKEGTKPPVFLAGDFGAWECVEMEYEVKGEDQGEEEYRFHKTIEAEEGHTFQYKFRVGLGDWWVLDESSSVVTDSSGNRNNLLIMPSTSPSDHADEHSHQDQPQMQQNKDKEVVEENSQLNDSTSKEQAIHVESASELNQEELKNMPTPQVVAIDDQVPKLAEKADTSPSFAEDSEPTATFAEKDAHAVHSADAEPDLIDVRPEITAPVEKETTADFSDSKTLINEGVTDANLLEDKSNEIQCIPHTPIAEVASIAAEVGESAAILDRETATPEVPDSEAGLTGLRRMSATPIPEVANTAAEVADSAAAIDREESSTPELTEEEAGRIGRRRMSMTPISQVAETAAEVAAVAALLDKDLHIELLPGHSSFDFDDDKEYPITPEDERAPLFSHEKFIPSSHVSPPQSPFPGHEAEFELGSPTTTSWEDRALLLPHERYTGPGSHNSPGLEEPMPAIGPEHLNPLLFHIQEFPTTREGIMAQLAQIQHNLPEDEVRLTSPSSPMSPSQYERLDVTAPGDSPRNDHRSPLQEPRAKSLESIVEENDDIAEEKPEADKENQMVQLVQDSSNLEAVQYAQISEIIDNEAHPEKIMGSSDSAGQAVMIGTTKDSGQLASIPDHESAKAIDSAADEAAEESVAKELVLPESHQELMSLGIPLGAFGQELDQAPAEFIDSIVKEDVHHGSQKDEIKQEDENIRPVTPTSEIARIGDDAVSDDTPSITPTTSNEGDHSTPIDVTETVALEEPAKPETKDVEHGSTSDTSAIIIHPATMPTDQVLTLAREAAVEEEIPEESHAPEPKSAPVPGEVKTHVDTPEEDIVMTVVPTPEDTSSKAVPDNHIYTQLADRVMAEAATAEDTSKPAPAEVKTHIHTQQGDTIVAVSRDTSSNEFSEPATTVITESIITKRQLAKPSAEQSESPVTMDGATAGVVSVQDSEEHAGLLQMFCVAVMSWFGDFFAHMCGDREKGTKGKSKDDGGKVKRV